MSRYDARCCLARAAALAAVFDCAEERHHDPNIVNEFARTVGDQTHLVPLLLTVADVRGTNPKI